MALMKILIDTNLCLDAILSRKPFAVHALELVERSELGDFKGMIAAHSFDNLFYILSKKLSRKKAYKGLNEIRKAFDVTAVTPSVIDNALHSEWKDFEDAIHYHAARATGCDGIITRNSKDFDQTDLPIFSPIGFLEKLDE